MSRWNHDSRLPSDVVTDAASDICNRDSRTFLQRCEPALKGYESRTGLSIGRRAMQPKRTKDQDIYYSLEGSKRRGSLYDSGLGDSLVTDKAEADCQHDFRVDMNESLPRRIEENYAQRRGSCQGSISNRKLVSIGTDEGYESVLSGSSWTQYDNSDKNNQVLFRRNDEGDTPLHLLIIHMLLGEISFFCDLATSPSQVNIVNDMQQSPLILAAMTKQAWVVRKLLVAGADLLLTDRHGNTPLHIAARNGDLETIKSLTKPITTSEANSVKYSVETQRIPQNMDLKNYEGYAPIHLAAAEGHAQVVEYLVELGAEVDEMEAKSGLRPLHIAIEREDRELIRVLVEESAADIDATTFYGLSPVELAAERGLDDVVVYLVNMGADRTDLDVPEVSDCDDDVEDMEVEFKDMKLCGVPVYK